MKRRLQVRAITLVLFPLVALSCTTGPSNMASDPAAKTTAESFVRAWLSDHWEAALTYVAQSGLRLASVIRHEASLRGSPRTCRRSNRVRSPYERSSGLPFTPSAPPREVPGFGAVPDRSFGSRHGPSRRPSRESPLGCPSQRPVARSPSPLEPARGPAVDRRHVFGCLLDREGSESPLSPQSLPVRLDPEGSRFRISPHSVPLGFLPVLGERDPRPETRIPVADTCAAAELDGNSMGTRREPIEDLRRRRGGRSGGATLRPLRRASRQSGSESRPSPIQRRVTAAEA